MLYKVRCNQVHPVNGALLGPYVPVRLHAVLWSHIDTLMHRLAEEPGSTAGLIFPSRCPSGTILLTQCSMVWAWRVSRAVLYSFSLSLFFIGWYCGAGVFGLIGCISLSLSLALPTFLNNNKNNTLRSWYRTVYISWWVSSYDTHRANVGWILILQAKLQPRDWPLKLSH